MSWNEILYVYQKEKGGVFMGSRAADWDGELILSCRDEPLVVRTIYETPGRTAHHPDGGGEQWPVHYDLHPRPAGDPFGAGL